MRCRAHEGRGRKAFGEEGGPTDFQDADRKAGRRGIREAGGLAADIRCLDRMIFTFLQIKMVRPTDSDDATPRKANLREAILCAAEDLFSTNGFNAVSVRDIAQAAGANPGSVTYHFKTKDGLLLEIYRRHCGPMNVRRP